MVGCPNAPGASTRIVERKKVKIRNLIEGDIIHLQGDG
jgi:hypothetical protein